MNKSKTIPLFLFPSIAVIAVIGLLAFSGLEIEETQTNPDKTTKTSFKLKGITTTAGIINEELTQGQTKTIDWKVGAFYEEPVMIILSSDSELISLPDSRQIDNEWHTIPVVITIPDDYSSGDYSITLSATKLDDSGNTQTFNMVMSKLMEIRVT